MTAHAGHVLVVAYDFPPHAAIGTMRTLRVVRQLHESGWQVTVLTGDPRSFLATTPVDQKLLERVPAGVHVVRAGSIRGWQRLQQGIRGARPAHTSTATAPAAAPRGTTQPRTRSGLVAALARGKDVVDAALAIPDREIGWLLPAITRGVFAATRGSRPDLIYASSPPWSGMLVATALKSILRLPLVADFRDPWARAPWRGDRYPFALRAAGRLERHVVAAADRIVFVAQGNRDDFAAFYGADVATKFHVVPNGCDPAEFDQLPTPERRADVHVMLHAGSLYGGRTPVPLFKGIARAIKAGTLDRDRFRLRFLGATSMQSVDLPAACRDAGIEPLVEFTPRVPRADSIRAMTEAGSLLLLQPGHTVSVPGKVYEYLAAGRPILSIAEEGETAHVVRSSGVGLSLTPDDEAGIAEGIATVVRMAAAGVPRAPREIYDGNLGAATIEAILRAALRAPLDATQAAASDGRQAS